MNQLINNRVGKPKKKRTGRGLLFLIIGSLAALLGVGLFVLAVSLITGKVIEARHGEEVAYALMTAVKPCYGVAFFLFYGILGVWYIAPVEEKKKDGHFSPMLGGAAEAEQKTISRRTLWLITAALAAGILLTGAVAVNTYRLVSTEGVSEYVFIRTSYYSWEEVAAGDVDCDTDGGLSMNLIMQDGETREIMQGVNSATAKFRAEYTTVTHFAADIHDRLIQRGVSLPTKNRERAIHFYKDVYPELWPYVARIIEYVDLQ